MDQDVINLAKAIRDKESGGNFSAVGDAGTSKGGYQWQPATWKANAKDILGDENADMTPDNQNAVAYGVILKDKQKGLNPAQIAAKWNSGKTEGWENMIGTTNINGQKIKYNVPQYVKDVTDNYQKYKNEGSTIPPAAPVKTPQEIADEKSANTYNPTFASKTGESAIVASAKVLGNMPKSAFNLVKNVASAVFNPVDTITNIVKNPYESLVPGAARDIIGAGVEYAKNGNTPAIDAKLQSAKNAIENDPVGQILPFVTGARGVASKVDKTISKANMANYVDNIGENVKKGVPIPKNVTPVGGFMDNVASAVTQPVRSAFSKVGDITDRSMKTVAGQATGLNPETLTQITKSPEIFTKEGMSQIDRPTLGRAIQSTLQKKIADVSETGSAYGPIRQSAIEVKVAPDFLQNTVRDLAGVEVNKGTIKASGVSKIRDAKDIRALQHLYDLWQPVFEKGKMNPDEFLNFRQDLAKLSKFEKEIGKSAPIEGVTAIMRGRFNESYRPQIEGLDKLDTTFADQTTELKTLGKGLIDKEGNLTDSAINKIANATGKGRDPVLARLEELMPGITQRIKILKAVEDIQNASGIKVGTYGRGALIGGGFVLGGPVQAAINAILSSPELAVPIIRRYGLVKNSNAIQAIVNALKKGGSATAQPTLNAGAFSPRLEQPTQ